MSGSTKLTAELRKQSSVNYVIRELLNPWELYITYDFQYPGVPDACDDADKIVSSFVVVQMPDCHYDFWSWS